VIPEQATRRFEDVRAYLAAPRCAVISTLTPSGAPHQAVVHYLPQADGLLINGRPDRRWCANLRADPRVSLVVHDLEATLHWVGIRGTAELAAEGDQAVEDAMTIARRYGEDPEDFRHLERLSFRIAAGRVFEYGQSGGG
jgi:PPOX class probable F420-dependent enzyme